ncbi:MAG: SulP family inorganic anion transporter, partial [Desulfovibrionaceae bacterium]|nr:SulP family inorganic anion transporter [Desulfovibrionaceae bacterium]
SAGIIGVFFALRSRFPFAVAGPETTVCAVLFMFVGSLCAGMSSAPPEVLYPTAVAGVTLTAVLTGLGAYLLGKLKAGTFLRFVPMEIVGGVLAGLGWYLIRGAWVFMTGRQLSLAGLWDSYAAGGFQGLFSQAELSAFLPGLFLGLLLLAVFCRFKNSAALLGVILGFVGLDAAARHLDIPLLSGLLRGHCLPGDVRLDRVLDVFSSDFFGLIHWPALAEHEILMACMVVLVVVTAMSTVTHLEAALGREVDMDGELKALGADNVLAGLCGGMPGSVSLGRSLGNLSCGGRGAASGVLAGILCLAALFFASPLLGFVPKFVPAGLLIYFGLGLLYNWLVASRRELNRRDDYFMLVLAFLATVFFGLVMGVGLGVGLAFMVTLSRYTKAGVVKNRLSGAKHRSNVDRAPSQVEVLRQKGDNIYIVRLQGFIFPGSLHALLKEIRDRAKAIDRLPLRFLVLDFLFVRGLGSAMNISFIKLRHLCERFDIQVVFTSAPLELEDMLVNSGYVLNREGGRFQLFMDLDYGMEWCENRLLEEAGVLKVQEIGLARLLEPVFPDAASIPAFVRCLQKVEVKKRQYVFRQGDLSDVMYFIEKGFLNVELELDGGKVLRLKKMGPGAVFGEMGFYTKTPRSASVVAAEACVIYRLTRERLEAIQARSPKLVSAFNRFLVNLLAARVAEANVKVRDLLG